MLRYGFGQITPKSNLKPLRVVFHGPAALSLFPHALAPVADLPVLEIMSARHIVADLTLGLGSVEFDYLENKE